jgi:pimeloyl-ACP methyl ester carboxylesterase
MFIHETGTPGKPIIVFLHGNGASGSMWRNHMRQQNDFHCLAQDFPDFGQSGSLNWLPLGETTDEVIKAVRMRTPQNQVNIVCLSLGGSVAMTWLSPAPDFVDHAIVDEACVQSLPGLTFMKIDFRRMQPFRHTDFIIRTIARMVIIPIGKYGDFKWSMLAMSHSSFTRAFLQANSMRLPPGLKEVNCRVLFVTGKGNLKQLGNRRSRRHGSRRTRKVTLHLARATVG